MRKKHVFTGILLVILFVIGSITGANAQCSANAGVDTSICKGLRFTRTALYTPVAASVKWFQVGVATAVSSTPTIDLPMNTAGTFRFAVEVSSALCAAPKYDTVVVVVNEVAANAGRDSVICQGSSFIRTANVIGSQIQWFSQNNRNTILSNISTLNISSPSVGDQTYIVRVSIPGTANCTALDSFVLSVLPNRVIAGNDTSLCQGQPFVRTATVNASPGVVTSWYLSTNSSAILSNTSSINHTPISTGTYNYVVKILSGSAGCISFDTVKVTVNQKPTAIAGIDRTICQEDPLTITASITPPNGIIKWYKLGTSTVLASTAAFQVATTIAGTTSYLLQVETAPNCSNADTVKVTVNSKPVAGFTYSVTCGKEFNFTNTSTTAAGSITSYCWNFGTGYNCNSTNASPRFVFPRNNTTSNINYTVRLIIENSFGCSDTVSQNVSVPPTISAELASEQLITRINGEEYYYACTSGDSLFTFYNNSLNSNSTTTYFIRWGDGTSNSYNQTTFPPLASSGSFVTHNYNTGIYTLTFIMTNNGSCVDSIKYKIYVGNIPAGGVVGLPASTICAGSQQGVVISGTASNTAGTIYTLSYNDGSDPLVLTAPIPDPDTIYHVFNKSSCGTTSTTAGGASFSNAFGAYLTIQSPCGNRAGSVVPIFVADKPKSDFTISPLDSVCTGQAVTLTNTSIPGNNNVNGVCTPGKAVWKISPTTPGTRYRIIGGGSLGTIVGTNPNNWTSGSNVLNIQFDSAGIYTIQIISANNNICGQDTMTKTIVVTGPTPPQVVSPVSYIQGATAVPLTAVGTGLRWYTTSSGGVGSSVAPTPSTANIGTVTYYVSQGAPNCEGARSNIVVNVISATANRPTANFSFSNPCGRAVQFTNQSSTPTGTTITQYQWTFNQGTTVLGTSSQANPTFTFPASGVTYNAQLVVTNSVGLKDSIRQNIITHTGPKPILVSEQSVTTINGVDYFFACTSTDSLFTFYNSSLYSTPTTSYVIRWGDGSSNSYTQNTFTSPASSGSFVTHNYNTGIYTLSFRMDNGSGCLDSINYRVYVGGIPSGGIVGLPASTLCSGSQQGVVISGTASNTPGTIYTLTYNDGTAPLILNAPIPDPDTIYHTFNNSSCGASSTTGGNTFQNAYGAYLNIQSPCGNRMGSVVPIYVADKPKASFTQSVVGTICPGIQVTLTNTGNPGNNNVNGVCTPGKSVWQITPNSPGTRFRVIGSSTLGTVVSTNPNNWTPGSDSLKIIFDSVGTYTIRMISANNNICGRDTMTQTISVTGPTPPQVASPVNYNQGAMAVPLTATGTGLRWYTAAVGGVGSTIAPTPSTANLGSVTYYVSQGAPNCEGARSSIVVNVSNGTRQQVGINVTQPQRSLHVNDMMRLEPRSAPPTNPAEGDIYYDGVLKKLRYYNGTIWKDL